MKQLFTLILLLTLTVQADKQFILYTENGSQTFSLSEIDSIIIKEEQSGDALPTINTADIYDRDGDGLADSIAIALTLSTSIDAFQASDVTEISYSWPTQSEETVSSNFLVESLDKIAITDIKINSTEGLGYVGIDFPRGSIASSLHDKVGPVIKMATFSNDITGSFDTVNVTFSEDITGVSASSVLLFHNGITTEPIESVDSHQFIFEKGTIQHGDSLSINARSTLTDLFGNPAHIMNHRVEVFQVR